MASTTRGRASLVASQPFACPLCAMPRGLGTPGIVRPMRREDSGPAGDRRVCLSCGLVVVMPRAAAERAISRARRG